MDTLRLLTGFLIPWIGGFSWLYYLEYRAAHGHPASLCRQLGYGFFLGCAAIQAAIFISTWSLGSIAFWPLVAGLTAASALGALLAVGAFRSGRSPSPAGPLAAYPSGSKFTVVLASVLLLAIVIHLALISFEVLVQALYPWDAWLVWGYRAKAWFYSNSVFELAANAAWLAGDATAPYTIDAHGYPGFASIMPLWASLSIGHWSESLGNVPVLFAALALLLALYGQCREHGISPLVSLAASYALLSIPIVGTHMSIAGYADIWLVGFTGLGFLALLRGLGEQHRPQLLLGLVMIGLGIGVKNEGVLWFYAAILLVLLASLRPKVVVSLIATFAGLCLVAWWTGATYFEIPLLGGLGVLEGKVHIPFIGSYRLQFFSVGQAYFDSFFVYGSWNLLWPLCLLALVLLPFLENRRMAKAIFVFFLIVASIQLFIFGATEQGQWAASFTAINRLPMQFVPAIVFCIAVVGNALLVRAANQSDFDSRNKFATRVGGVVPLIATVTVLAGAVYHLSGSLPPSFQQRTFVATDFSMRRGSAKVSDGKLIISNYKDGIAITSRSGLNINADITPLLEFDLLSETTKPPALFWRQASKPDKLQLFDLLGAGKGSVMLNQHPAWKGQVSEIGLAFYGNNGELSTAGSLNFTSPTLLSQLSIVWSDWTTFEPWTQFSVNSIRGGRDHQLLPAPILLGSWLALATALYLLGLWRGASARSAVYGACTGALLAWMLLDLKWLSNRWDQALATQQFTAEQGHSQCIDSGNDCQILELVNLARAHLQNPEHARVLIIQAEQGNAFQALRAKYHLLPAAAGVSKGAVGYLAETDYDLVLFIGKSSQERQLLSSFKQLQVQQKRRGKNMAFNKLESNDVGSVIGVSSL